MAVFDSSERDFVCELFVYMAYNVLTLLPPQV